MTGVCVTIEEQNNEEPNDCTKDVNTDPWPGYRFTGKLRPHYPLVRSLLESEEQDPRSGQGPPKTDIVTSLLK